MSVISSIFVLVGYISSLIMIACLSDRNSLIEKRYNDLRVKYASLKSKQGGDK